MSDCFMAGAAGRTETPRLGSNRDETVTPRGVLPSATARRIRCWAFRSGTLEYRARTHSNCSRSPRAPDRCVGQEAEARDSSLSHWRVRVAHRRIGRRPVQNARGGEDPGAAYKRQGWELSSHRQQPAYLRCRAPGASESNDHISQKCPVHWRAGTHGDRLGPLDRGAQKPAIP
jgi:hypothetical protein